MVEDESGKIIASLISIAAGYLLSQMTEWIKTRNRKNKKNIAIRRLIALEAKSNIEHVRALWDSILQKKNTWYTDKEVFMDGQLVEQLALTPIPLLKFDAWISNLNEVCSVYEINKLEKIWHLQRAFERIMHLHSFAYSARQDRISTSRQHSSGQPHIGAMIGTFQFVDTVQSYAKEFKSLVKFIHEFKDIDEC